MRVPTMRSTTPYRRYVDTDSFLVNDEMAFNDMMFFMRDHMCITPE